MSIAKIKRGLIVFTTLGLMVLCMTSVDAAEERDFPLHGVVDGRRAGLALRESPPTANGLSYKLSDRVCSLANGTEFIATDEVFVANGEIWFKIEAFNVKSLVSHPCPSGIVSGWMVARMKVDWVVEIVDQGLPEKTASTLLEAKSEPNRESKPGEEDETLEPISSYLIALLCLLGTAFAVCVVAIVREDALHPSAWFSKLLVFEFTVLSTLNILILLFLATNFSADSPHFLFQLLGSIKDMDGGLGNALLGAVFSIVFLRFMSFARQTSVN